MKPPSVFLCTTSPSFLSFQVTMSSFGPAPAKPKKRRLYTEDEYRQALDWALTSDYSVYQISRWTNVPKSTIQDHRRAYKLKKEMSTSLGRPTFFTATEEEGLAYWLDEMGKIHHPMTRLELMKYLGKWLRSAKKQKGRQLGKGGIPGK